MLEVGARRFDPAPRLFGPSIPMDIAYPILFLASDESAAMTGVDMPVDGGCAAGLTGWDHELCVGRCGRHES